MIKAREWPVRAMYILIAAALAISLFITAAPAQRVSANSNDVVTEWDKVSTPTMADWVLAPETTILDYALASDGEVTYAVVNGWNDNEGTYGSWLLKSTDSAATWDDITNALNDVLDTDEAITGLLRVETDDADANFVAVVLTLNVSVMTPVHVFFSTDGGTTFNDAGEVEDGGVYITLVSDIEVSPEVAGKRDIVVFGEANTSYGAGIFRCTVTGDSASAWQDATAYDGWDNRWTLDSNVANDIYSWIVTEGEFSPNYATDKTFLVTTIDDGYYVSLQSGSMGTTPAWNEKSTLGIQTVPIIDNVNMPTYLDNWDPRGLAGLTLPSDYNSKSTLTRVLWVWVNYYDPNPPYTPKSRIVRVDNDDSNPVVQQVKDGNVWLTNVSYYGTTAEGEAIAGVLGTGTDYPGGPLDLFTGCCEGVQVYRNTGIHNMDICCERWKKACKPPTGVAAMAVSFVNADKAYAVALQGDPRSQSYDEGAWSVTFDGGDTWNQLSLVDTSIHYFSDVAVSPDCNKMMLVSVNTDQRGCGCDSVWLKATNLPEAEEYSGKWLRTWCHELTGIWFESGYEAGFLRLPAGEITGDTVYLVDFGTGNVYQNDLETLGCWTSVASTTLTDIVDLAATGAAGNSTLYALDDNGDVSMYDSDGWHDAVDSKLNTYGWSIAVHGDYVLVGGMFDGEVSYSDDGGETFTHLQDKDGNDATTPIEGHTTVAFDTYFDTNNIIYAAIEGWGGDNSNGGIYRWVLGTSDKWEDTGAQHDLAYTGLVLSNINGNTHTSAATGGVLYASFVNEYCDDAGAPDCDTYTCWQTGVARSLNPAETIECATCVEWDYLTVGLDYPAGFQATPYALKICGCLTPDTNSKLFAIDSWAEDSKGYYDMSNHEDGAVWTFEDCYAKKAPNVITPTGNTTIKADPCSCYNAPFGITWDGLCDACHYEIQFALDEDFTAVWDSISAPREGSKTPTSYLVEGGEQGEQLSCDTVYYMRVRATQAGTCQVIHSWWSDPLKVTIAPSVGQAVINLVAPVPGAQDAAIKNLGFSWNTLADADKFDWKLSTNADLSSPIESKTGLTAKAYGCTKTLVHGTTYYWQVTAYKAGVVTSTSAIGTFTTGATGAFCDPIDGMCFDTQAELQAHEATSHPAPATPFWVWVVIAIGAVLVIVVIVLIFRTRRV
jgi:hypothetical protein